MENVISEEAVKQVLAPHLDAHGHLKPGYYTVKLDGGESDDAVFCYLRNRLTMNHESALEVVGQIHHECPRCICRRLMDAKNLVVLREDLKEPEKSFFNKASKVVAPYVFREETLVFNT